MKFLTCGTSLLCLAVYVSPLFAQQGDRKGHKMVDPVPADQIPPSPYLNLDEALKSFQLAEGYVIEPVASGENVDLVVALSFDANGRAWTCEMRSYMPDLDGNGESTPNGRIRVLEDVDGDGQVDKVTTFLDGLVLPRAVAVTSDGCLYTSGDALYFVQRNGLKPVGEPYLIDKNYAQGGNPEHKANGLIYGHDNWYYSAKSDKRYRRMDGEWVIQSTNHRGQWGIAKDNAGRLYYNNNSTLLQGDQFAPHFFRGHPHYTPKAKMSFRLGSNRVHPIHMTPGVNRGYMKGVLDDEGKLVNATAACGVHIYRGDNFPPSVQGMGFSCEPSGDLVKAVQITRDRYNQPRGSHPFGNSEFLASSDEWFLPCSLYTAPDGTLWMVDMYFGLLQHKAFMTSYLRKQYVSRGLDRPKASTGRIYRIRYADKKASSVPKLEGVSPEQLVAYLVHPNGTVRDIAQRLIVESGETGEKGETKALVGKLEKMVVAGNPYGAMHALWALDGLGEVNSSLLARAVSRGHTDVSNSALDIIAHRRLNDPALVKAIKKMRGESQTLHSRIRALAAAGAEADALQLVRAHSKVALVREAFISGVGIKAGKFHQAHGKLADKSLEKLLVAAAKSQAKGRKKEGSHLRGAALASYQRGKNVYMTKGACVACHGADGVGMPNLGPPLAKSEWVIGDASRLGKILLHGMTGPVVVNGSTYNPPLAMPGLSANQAISDQDLADVMTYLRNSWSNKAKPVLAREVKKTRAATMSRTTPYTASDLTE